MSRRVRSSDQIRESWPYGSRRTYAVEVERASEFGLDAADVLILKALSHGLNLTEIPAVTPISLEYMKERMRNHILPKLRAKNHAHALANALRAGIIT